jgi:hypothetical protein
MEGYIYVISAPEVSRVKIGMTRTYEGVKKRYGALQCGSPFDLILHSAKHHKRVEVAEAALHKRFRNAHIRGEWFDSNHPKVARWMRERELQGFLWAAPPRNPRRNGVKKSVILDDTRSYLIELFSDGEPRLAIEVIDEIVEQGIASKRTVETAKAQLGIISMKKGDRWWWVQS